jgi:hypothetical protein
VPPGKLFSRRSVTTGMLAGVAAIPALVLSVPAMSPHARVEFHTRELEKAMREIYGTKEVVVLRSEPDEGGNPFVMVCPSMTEEQRARYAQPEERRT